MGEEKVIRSGASSLRGIGTDGGNEIKDHGRYSFPSEIW